MPSTAAMPTGEWAWARMGMGSGWAWATHGHAHAFIFARMKEFSTAQLIITSAMAHEGASASHGARFWPLGPQPWHREATRKRRAAGPRQRQEIVIPGVYVRFKEEVRPR